MKKELAIILVSGGMDSLAIAAIASEKYELAMLHLNYGQNTQDKEQECFTKIADHFRVAAKFRKVIDISFLAQIGGSSLTDKNIDVSKDTSLEQGVPTSYVPFRNTHILSMAVSWGEIISASKIFIGAVEEDHMGYPDCRPSYYKAFNELIKQGTKDANIEVLTPIIQMKKDEILNIIFKHKAPVKSTWSCYERNDLACGSCDSCMLRLNAFKELGQVDPIKYLNN
jgi:7-cyano-7-deazaguanine synthase